MKKLTFLLLALFVSIGAINAQTVDITVNVLDDTGTALNNVAVTLEASLCDSTTFYNTSGNTSMNGAWTDSFQGCNEGSVYVYAACPVGSAQSAYGTYDANNTSLTFNLTCASTPPCDGNVIHSQGQTINDFDFDFNASAAITDYSWDFGDGTTSTDPAPSHTFPGAGYYEVYLTTNGAAGTCIYFDSLEVETCFSDFTTTPDANDPLTITMTSNITGGTAPLSYYWNFDDGNTSTDANPTHTYANNGAYYISLTVTDATGGSCTNYYYTQVGNQFPLDSCLDWDMIDPTTVVCDTIVDPVCGCDNVTYKNQCIAANFYGLTTWTQGPCAGGGNGGGGNPTDSTCTDVTVDFTYTSTGLLSYDFVGTAQGGTDPFDYYWDFGDGSHNYGAAVSHTFPQNGNGLDEYLAYSVCLTADTSGCSAIACETIVLALNPFGNFSGVIVEGANLTGGTAEVAKGGGPGDPIEGVEVLLLSTAGTQIGTSTTNAQGEYGFDNLNFGDYIIKVNINGILHEGEPFKLTPSAPSVPNADFNVTDDGVVTVGIDDRTKFINSFSIAPNPTHDRVNITIGIKETTTLQLSVTNLLGQQVVTEELLLNRGKQTLDLDLSSYAAGIYLVSLRSGKEIITKKIVKE